MGKSKKPAAKYSSTKKTARTGQVILLVCVLAAFVGAYFLWNQDSGGGSATSSGSSVPSGLRDRMILPATPHVPRPVTLDPALFPDPEVKRSYQVAQSDPEPLEHVACYCGCFNSSGHRNNLDCFKDSHGAT
jgi:hypothetical protein